MAQEGKKEKASKKEEGKAGFRQSYKFRLYPTEEQKRNFQMNFDCCRFVYNHYLEARIKAHEAYKADPEHSKPLTLFNTTKDLTRLKRETLDEDGHAWLDDADARALVYALHHLDSAYQNFFRRVKQGEAPGFPNFKSRHAPTQSFRTILKALGDGWIKLPKVGRVRAKTHRKVEGEVVAVTISKNAANQYYASINVKEVEKAPLPQSNKEVGISLGLRNWVVASDGEVIDNPKTVKKYEKKLAREQKNLSRKQPGSANHEKQRLKLARLHVKIANTRAHATHELTRQLVDENEIIASRDVRTQNMAKDSKSKSSKINRSLADANLAEVNRQLDYKSEWARRTFVLVPNDVPTSQVCHTCGYKEAKLADKIKTEWECPQCHAVHNRRHNGACNILAACLDILHGQEEAYVTKTARETREKKKEVEESRG